LHDSCCTLGIVSNTEAVLTRFDLDCYPVLLDADTIVLSSDVRTPDVQIFEIALERLHAATETAVFVGNSMAEDVEGARRAGLRALYLDDRATGLEPLDTDVLRAATMSGPIRWSANSNRVTTPKLPPPPRMAQKKSG
jgi:FMN phosphatase YigB (HAD superfamily)